MGTARRPACQPCWRPVVICLKVRRFLCQNVACKAVTFDGQANVTVR